MDMKVISEILWTVLLLFTTVYAGGNICYMCDNVPHPADCNRIAQCAPHEVCSVTQYKTHIGIIYYKTSCQDKQLCPPTSGRKKRQDAVYCTECCEKDYCNKKQCDTSHVNVIEKRCLHCDDVAHPSECKNVARCGPDSMCYVEEVHNLGYAAPRYKLGCKSKTLCNTLLSLTGRDLSRRSSTCRQCCDTENCNGKLCGHIPTQTLGASSGNCSDQLSDCSALQKQVNVCSQPQTAALCQQTCGLCTGTCKDQLSDCSVLKQQVNVCGDKTSAALCQQTCGLCGSTSSPPVNGGWSNWSPWGNCSKTCGSGTETRTRSCSHPAPNYGGAQCSGSATESKSCLLTHCPLIVNGGWSSWVKYGQCTVSCGGGNIMLRRTCSNPAPSGGGSPCSGSDSTYVPCNTNACPYIPVQPVQPTTGCDSGWVEYSGMCYIIIKQRMTWNSALSHCHSLSGTLAEGYSHSVNDFLRNMMLSDHSACKYCWLGGQKSGGHWRWLTSGSFHYTDWNTHEPDNKYGNENCLEMGYHVDNHWNDQSCSDTRNFICQKRKP